MIHRPDAATCCRPCKCLQDTQVQRSAAELAQPVIRSKDLPFSFIFSRLVFCDPLGGGGGAGEYMASLFGRLVYTSNVSAYFGRRSHLGYKGADIYVKQPDLQTDRPESARGCPDAHHLLVICAE